MSIKYPLIRAVFLFITFFITGCTAMKYEPIPLVKYVDLERFMGAWYVIAHIPSYPERNAFNAIERYELNDNGTIATTFTFNEGDFDGKFKTLTPVGFITDEASNAVWGMQFIWPIKADYRIAYIDDNYTETVIAREKRDYVWIMARTPEISEVNYNELINFVESLGYDKSLIRKVPQKIN